MVREDAGTEDYAATSPTATIDAPQDRPPAPPSGGTGAAPASGPLPPARRTGLIVVAALAILLVVGIAVAMIFVPASRSGQGQTASDPSATKARIEAAIGVMKALRVNDLAAVRPYLVDDARTAITDAQWNEAASASEIASATFAPTVWSGESTASVDYTVDGGTGTMIFAPKPGVSDVVTMFETGPEGDLIYDVELTAVGSGWRAVALTPRAEPFLLDVDFVKSLVETPAP